MTGGSSGLGFAIASRLALEGARVIIAGRNQKTVDEAVLRLNAMGGSAESLVMDVTDEQGVRAAITRIADRHPALDILVHSAGIVGPTHIKTVDYPTEAFSEVLGVNLRGSFLVVKYALPRIRRNPAGRILLLASMAGKDGNPGMMGYTASKAAVFGLVKALGREYAEAGVIINGFAPAVVRTPLVDAMDPAQVEYLAGLIPMRRPGTLAEVAALGCWIVSPECSFTTGFVFDLSGGRATY